MSANSELPEYVVRNRSAWDRWADAYAGSAEHLWAATEISWGIWHTPESELRVLDGIEGTEVIDLGCGTGYFSAWLARRGARPVGIDNSPRQLETARRLQAVHKLEFPLLLGNAESVPYPDASFDFAISEYGAATWADPYKWIPEAARLLRPKGRLAFLTNGYLESLCEQELSGVPATDRLLRPQFRSYRYEWPDDESVEFHLPHGQMIRLLHDAGFEVEDLFELQAPAGATTGYKHITADWANKWPSEELWKARKRG